MWTMFVLVLFPVHSMAKELDTDIHIYEQQKCKLVLELHINNAIQNITSAAFDFNRVQWRTDVHGKKKGYLKSTFARSFIRDVEKHLNVLGRKSPPPRLWVVAFCKFDVQIPGVTVREIPDITPILAELWRDDNIAVHKMPLAPISGSGHNPTMLPPPRWHTDTPTTTPVSMEATKCPECQCSSCNLCPWVWIAIGATVSGNFFCISVLVVLTLHYRKRCKELESKEIPTEIRSRAPLPMPPEVIYDAVYSNRVNRFLPKKPRPRYISIGDITST